MPTTRNHMPSLAETAPVSDEARELYSIDAIHEWRSDESLRLGWLRTESIESSEGGDEYLTTFRDAIDAKLNEFLAARGIAEDDPEYAALRQLYRESSIDRVHENEWGNSPASRGVDPNDTQSQSDKVSESIRQWHENYAATTVRPEDGTTEAERSVDDIRTELEAARDAWADMQAKRQGRLWDRRIPGYNAAKDRYHTLQQELGARTLADTVNSDTLTDAEKNAAVIAYVFDEQNTLRAKTKEKVGNTKVSKFVEKFGGWLNKGSGWKKFGKGVLVGATAGIVGAGAGLLFGAAGAGALIAGAGAMVVKGAMRFTKAYAKSDAANGRGMETMSADKKNEWTNSLPDQEGDSVIDMVVGMSRQEFEKDAKKEQAKRRKTTAIALGGVAVGAGIGAGIGLAIDHFGVTEHVQNGIFGHSPADGDTAGGNIPPETVDARIDEAVKEAEERVRDEYDGRIEALEDRIDELSSDTPVDVDLDMFEFGYGTATEDLLHNVVSEQLGTELSGSEAYSLINHLMEATDGNIFEGITTEYHGAGNVWIMNPGGETSGLTQEAMESAKDWLGMKDSIGFPSSGN